MAESTKKALTLVPDILRMGRETDMLTATVLSLAPDELTAPSKCEGWTRAHVVAHLAGNADALSNLCHWATTGEPTPMYASQEARDARIQELAALPADELKAAYVTAVDRVRDAMEGLKEGVKVEELEARPGVVFSAYELPARRTNEVVIHHYDLDTLWELHEADPESLLDGLLDSIRRMQAKPDCPGLTLKTDEGDEWVVGDGATTVLGERDAMLGWLARGDDEGRLEVQGGGELPELPSWG